MDGGGVGTVVGEGISLSSASFLGGGAGAPTFWLLEPTGPMVDGLTGLVFIAEEGGREVVLMAFCGGRDFRCTVGTALPTVTFSLTSET